MTLVEEAFAKLYPNKEFSYTPVVEYSNRFRGYNARVQLDRFARQLTFKLSGQWRNVSNDIQMGLIQSLMVRILKKPGRTMNMELYELFLKNLPDTIPRTKTHPLLEAAFHRVNEKYLGGLMSMPNFELKDSVSLLGTYHYSTDTIAITKMLLENEPLLDYVMYHEVLHKKHKFNSKNGRHNCHTKAFRDDEHKFELWDVREKELQSLVTKHARRNRARSFFKFF